MSKDQEDYDLVSFRALGLRELPDLSDYQNAVGLCLSNNKITSLKGFPIMKNLVRLTLDYTEINSLQYVCPQPSLISVSLISTPFSKWHSPALMCYLAFGPQLTHYNNTEIKPKTKMLAEYLRDTISGLLKQGWVVTDMNPLVMLNVNTKRKKTIFSLEENQNQLHKNSLINCRSEITVYSKTTGKKICAPNSKNKLNNIKPGKESNQSSEDSKALDAFQKAMLLTQSWNKLNPPKKPPVVDYKLQKQQEAINETQRSISSLRSLVRDINGTYIAMTTERPQVQIPESPFKKALRPHSANKSQIATPNRRNPQPRTPKRTKEEETLRRLKSEDKIFIEDFGPNYMGERLDSQVWGKSSIRPRIVRQKSNNFKIRNVVDELEESGKSGLLSPCNSPLLDGSSDHTIVMTSQEFQSSGLVQTEEFIGSPIVASPIAKTSANASPLAQSRTEHIFDESELTKSVGEINLSKERSKSADAVNFEDEDDDIDTSELGDDVFFDDSNDSEFNIFEGMEYVEDPEVTLRAEADEAFFMQHPDKINDDDAWNAFVEDYIAKHRK